MRRFLFFINEITLGCNFHEKNTLHFFCILEREWVKKGCCLFAFYGQQGLFSVIDLTKSGYSLQMC